MAQEKVTLINIKRSTATGKTHETTIFRTLFDKKEAILKAQGWLLKSDIDEIVVEEINDGLGAVEVVEEVVETLEVKSYTEMTLAELQAECKAQGLKFHHANKETKLISILETK